MRPNYILIRRRKEKPRKKKKKNSTILKGKSCCLYMEDAALGKDKAMVKEEEGTPA